MKKILLSLIFINFLLIGTITNAESKDTDTVSGDDKYTLLEPLPCIEGTGNGNCSDGKPLEEISLNDYIGYIFKFAIALAVFLAVLMIIWGGFEYILSEIPSVKVDAKGRIQNAVIGLIMALASYLILATIDPRLVEINTSIPKIKIDTKDVVALRSQLDQDLKNLSAADKLKGLDIAKQIDDDTQRLDKLKAEAKNRPLTDDEKKELATIESRISKNENALIKLKASDVGLNTFSGIAKSIANSPKSFYEEIVQNGVELIKSQMQSSYESSVQQLRDNNDYEGAQTVRDEGQFYTNQIDDEIAFIKVINFYDKPDKISFLKKLSDNYQERSINANTYVNSTLVDKYRAILSHRIQTIGTYIDTNQKK